MRKHIEIIICDRCGQEYETRGRSSQNMELQFMYLQNGSGSGTGEKDLCPLCTEAFKRFWDFKKDV